ncbi:dihydroorotate oxidase B electron transfer subunit [Bacillus carboniphilus]|uniref:Dihydroorotate dehydrogenase B (NAD(+)), electron transfer subunit n=1 Tax=Bacillus carboniphilus TaxID=86663 RepID=A0ABP3FZR8_9BACI
MRIEDMTIIEHEEIAQSTYRLVLEGELVTDMTAPGQFVHIQVGDHSMLLRRPISISEYSVDQKRCTLIYRAGGSGTGTQYLSQKQVGEKVNVLGPLGNGFTLPSEKSSILIVGGGIGVPPLYELSKQLVEKGHQVTHVFGFQNKESIFLEDEFAKLGPTFIATNDGSRGQKGFVTDVIEKLDSQFDDVFACGPTPMLKALKNRFTDDRLWISMEERMGCGVGACFACIVKQSKDDGSYYKVCCDGPVFLAKEVLV